MKDLSERQKKVLNESVKQIDKSFGYWSDNVKRFRNNLDFVLGYQWKDESTSYLRRKQETRLTFNLLYPYIKSIMGEQLQNTPAPAVRAASDDIEQWEVNLYEGILRGIFYDSKMPQQTYSVFFNQLSGGFGAYRVCPEYEGCMSFDQNIKIYTEEDPTQCYWDPDAKDPCKVTGKYCGRLLPMEREAFNEAYPEVKNPAGFALESYPMQMGSTLYKDNYVIIAEHWRKEFKNTTIVQLSDGSVMEKDDYEPYVEKLHQKHLQKTYLNTLNNIPNTPDVEIPQIVKSKRDRIYKIRYYKMIQNTILEEKDWPGELLPLVYVDGDSAKRRGKQEIKSFCEYAKDPQRFYNYTVSQISQQIKNFRREQWIGEPESVAGKGINEMWRNPEEQAGILLANRDSAGQLPTKLPPSAISPDLLNAKQFLIGDIQNILGRHEASQGQQSPEISGIALFNRIVQDNMGSYLQINNLGNAIECVAQICVDMIPHFYDSERTVLTRDKKNNPTAVTLNKFKGMQQKDDGTYSSEIEYYENQIQQKRFRVELSAGPSFAAQKQLEFNKLMQLIQIPPSPVATAIIDTIVENIDLPNTNQLVNRLKTLVPPQVLLQSGELTDEEKQQVMQQMQQQSQQPPPPEVQAQMQRNQIEQQKLQMQQQQMQLDQQNDQVQHYLDGLRTQVDMQKISQESNANQMSLQKDLIQANTELKTTAMNTLHKIHTNITNLTRQRDAARNVPA